MERYYIDDVQWWYDNGGYDMAKIADLLYNIGAKNIIRKKKYSWPNMPEVIVFKAKPNDLPMFNLKFTEVFGSSYSFSCLPIWENYTKKIVTF